MPQTKTGADVMSKFISQYGKRGKNIFYAKAVKSKTFAKAVGESSVHRRAKGNG